MLRRRTGCNRVKAQGQKLERGVREGSVSPLTSRENVVIAAFILKLRLRNRACVPGG